MKYLEQFIRNSPQSFFSFFFIYNFCSGHFVAGGNQIVADREMVPAHFIAIDAHRGGWGVSKKLIYKNGMKHKKILIFSKKRGPIPGYLAKNLIYPPPPDFRPCSSLCSTVSIKLT